MEESAFLGGVVAGLVSFIVGVRLIRLSWRSQKSPEFLLGMSLFLWGLAYACWQIPIATANQPLTRPLFFAGRVFTCAATIFFASFILDRISQSGALGESPRLRDRDRRVRGHRGILRGGRLGGRPAAQQSLVVGGLGGGLCGDELGRRRRVHQLSKCAAARATGVVRSARLQPLPALGHHGHRLDRVLRDGGIPATSNSRPGRSGRSRWTAHAARPI